MSHINQGSQVSNDGNDNDDSYNQAQLQTLKQEITLSNLQLLQLTYNDQKFFQKLSELNHIGCEFITKLKYHEALIYLNEAQKILEYAASCGKTIQRSLIITTLNNESALYQRAWQLQKAASYIQAIIYNISSFFQGNSTFTFTDKILDEQSTEHQDFSIFLGRKISLSLYYLQFCAVNSQNKNHQNAFSSAFKAVNMLKQICSDLFKYQNYIQKNDQHDKIIRQQSNIRPCKMILYELANLKQFDQNNLQQNIQKYYQSTLKHMSEYIKRTKQQISLSMNSNYNDIFRQHFANYSIGYLMQINPIKIQKNQEKTNVKQELSEIKKIFKSVYISVGFFILATQLRFISSQKHTLDENQRRNSIQYKESKIYHMMSIIVASKYLPCESVYFQHIVNSFRNHYKIDILEDAKKFIQLQRQNINYDTSSNQHSNENNHHLNQQESSIFHKSTDQNKQKQQILEITKKQGSKKKSSPISLPQQEQPQPQQQNQLQPQRQRYLQLTQQEQEIKRQYGKKLKLKLKLQQNYNLNFSKKNKIKQLKNKMTKSHHRLQTQESNRIAQSNHDHDHDHDHAHHQKNNKKRMDLNLITSREKQNKIKNKLSSHSSKKSRQLSSQNNLVKKKSLAQGVNQINSKKSNQDNQVYHNLENIQNHDYYKTSNKSRSKTKRTVQGVLKKSKSKRRQSSSYQVKKHKKIDKNDLATTRRVQLDQDQGMSQKRNKEMKINTKRSNANIMKKPSQNNKIGSPTAQMKKKMKSPNNIKKSTSRNSKQRLFF